MCLRLRFGCAGFISRSNINLSKVFLAFGSLRNALYRMATIDGTRRRRTSHEDFGKREGEWKFSRKCKLLLKSEMRSKTRHICITLSGSYEVCLSLLYPENKILASGYHSIVLPRLNQIPCAFTVSADFLNQWLFHAS